MSRSDGAEQPSLRRCRRSRLHQVGAEVGDSCRDNARSAERDVPKATWDARSEGCFRVLPRPLGCAGKDSERHFQHRLRTHKAARVEDTFEENTENGGINDRDISKFSAIPSNKSVAPAAALDTSLWGDATIHDPHHPQSVTGHVSKPTDRPDNLFSYLTYTGLAL